MKFYQNEWMLYTSLALTAGYSFVEDSVRKWLSNNLIVQNPVDKDAVPSRMFHDIKRNMTYPGVIPNTWYHLCDSKDVKKGEVIEIRALNQAFAVWRGEDGKVHCQDAYCIHLGANLAVGGCVEGDTIVCPFHRWRFDGEGKVAEVPYLKDPKNCPSHTKLKTYHCAEFCGWVCVYYHADRAPSDPPLFELPWYIQEEIDREGWKPHLQWDIGFQTTNVVDWVDQVGDHAHFHMLHTEFMIPWTLIKIPKFLLKLFPIGICHKLTTFLGDDKEWAEEVQKNNCGIVEKNYVLFYDEAALTWNGKIMESTKARTLETYVGPALVVFNVPFKIGKCFYLCYYILRALIVSILLLIQERSRCSSRRCQSKAGASCAFAQWLIVACKRTSGSSGSLGSSAGSPPRS